MEKKKIYLAGLINTDVFETLEWRLRAREELEELFEVLDPLRGKEDIYLGKDVQANATAGMVSSKMSPRALMLRDREDVDQAQIILANLYDYESGRPLTGTIYELAWAWEDGKLVIAFCPEDYWIRKHPFVSQTVAEWFPTLEEAVAFCKALLK